jgi:hypothetical protein
MDKLTLRDLFSDLNFPKLKIKREHQGLTYEDVLKIAAEELSQYVDFKSLNDKISAIQEEDEIKNDPVLQFLYQLKKASEKEKDI